MPVIDIHQPHTLGKQRCRAAVDAAAHDLATRYGLSHLSWNGDTLNFARAGLHGSLDVGELEAHIHLRLGLALGLLQRSIDAEVRRQLQQYLA